MTQAYLWEALTLKGEKEYGITHLQSLKSTKKSLVKEGYFKVEVRAVSARLRSTPLKIRDILNILNSLFMLLDSGVSLKDTFALLMHDQKSLIQQYIFCHLNNELNKGESLGDSFSSLDPLFPNFFLAMIKVSEDSGQLLQGINSLKEYYQQQDEKRIKLDQITRYPKVVLGISSFLTLGIILFIIPMFENIYQLYEGQLPLVTRILIFCSDFLRNQGWLLILLLAGFTIWFLLPRLRNWHPIVLIKSKVTRWLDSDNDPLVFAHAMHVLLENGVPVKVGIKLATACMSSPNTRYGAKIDKMLQGGSSFSEAFFETPWFPEIFHKFISSAEKAGVLGVGFKQIYLLIIRQKEERFNRWSKLIEPMMMLLLGTIILTLLLGIYLPIFNLGNQIN